MHVKKLVTATRIAFLTPNSKHLCFIIRDDRLYLAREGLIYLILDDSRFELETTLAIIHWQRVVFEYLMF